MKFISRVDQDISRVRAKRTSEISYSTREINVIFPSIQVFFIIIIIYYMK